MSDDELKNTEPANEQAPASQNHVPQAANDADSRANAPEPPKSYRGRRDEGLPGASNGEQRFKPDGANSTPFQAQQPGNRQPSENSLSARRYIGASQIMALVSLVFGGVLLSGAAIVTSFVGMRKTRALSSDAPADAASRFEAERLRRAAFVGMAMAIVAFIANAIALVYFYPMFLDAMQSGDYAGMFGGGQSGSGNAGSDSVWG